MDALARRKFLRRLKREVEGRLTRSELNYLAASLNVPDPFALACKADVLSAIEAAA